MKANAVCFHLWCELTSTMNVIAPIIFGNMHFLLISENEFTHEIKCNGITSFMEFMPYHSSWLFSLIWVFNVLPTYFTYKGISAGNDISRNKRHVVEVVWHRHGCIHRIFLCNYVQIYGLGFNQQRKTMEGVVVSRMDWRWDIFTRNLFR